MLRRVCTFILFSLAGLRLFASPLPGGCDVVVSVSVLVSYNGEDISCVGACNGVAIATATGGLPPYTYLWEDGQTNQVAIGLCSGTHTVTVTDATGSCSNTGSITLNDPPALVVATTAFAFPGGFNVSCFGENDGQITATAGGGVGGYSYFWSDGQLGPAALNVPAGSYFVQVTDANGCTDLDSLVMEQPDPLSAALSTIQPVSCAGRNDGSISLNMSGGSGGFTYAWDDGPTGPIRGGLSPGSYSVSVVDVNGCAFDTTIVIGNSPVLQAGIAAIQGESCAGAQDGAVDIQASGGTPPYAYRWNNGLSTQDISGLPATRYLLGIRDSRGCMVTVPVTILPESNLTVNSLNVNPSCNAVNGAIHLQVAGHIGSLSFLWSDGQTTASATGLSAGQYDVLIMDDDCMVSRTYFLNNSGSLSTTITETLTACNAPTGTAFAEVAGGLAPYTWLWSNGQTTQTATALDAGVYTVLVRDADGCQIQGETVIRENNDLAATITPTAPSACGANNGTVSLSPTAGTPPFSYSWSTGSSGAVATGLRSGLYFVRIADINGCADTLAISVEDGDLELSLSTLPAFCGAASGSTTSTISGGTAPYRYRWSSADTTSALSGIPPGFYTLVARDAAGCQTAQTTEIRGSDGVEAEADVQGISCESLQDGVINLTILAGVPAFSINWLDGSVEPDRTGLSPGVYEVEIQDAANCLAAGPVPLGDGCDLPLDAVDDNVQSVEGETQEIEVLVNDIYPDRDDIVVSLVTGAAVGSVSAGPDGTFLYTAPLGFTGADSFAYSLCNSFGVCDTAWVYITVVPQFQVPDAFSPNGDGVNDFFDIRGIDQFPENELVIFNRWGTEVFRTAAYTGGWPGKTENGTDLPAGTYYYRLGLGQESEPLAGYLVIHR